jgi:hypothetical protein
MRIHIMSDVLRTMLLNKGPQYVLCRRCGLPIEIGSSFVRSTSRISRHSHRYHVACWNEMAI